MPRTAWSDYLKMQSCPANFHAGDVTVADHREFPFIRLFAYERLHEDENPQNDRAMLCRSFSNGILFFE